MTQKEETSGLATTMEHAKKVHELAKIKELTVKNLEELLKFDITDCYDENDYYSDGKYGCTVNVYIPICFDPDKAFGLDVCEKTNGDYINMYINYDEQGNMELFIDYCNNSTDDGDIACVVKMTADEYDAVKEQFREQFERCFSITVEDAIKRELEEEQKVIKTETLEEEQKVVETETKPMYLVLKSDRCSNTGDIGHTVVNRTAFTSKEAARTAMLKEYSDELACRHLDDNGTSDEDGNSLPGGLQSGDECGIYDYCGHANGQLMLVCLITIQEIKG